MSQIAVERQTAAPVALPKITYEEFLERYDGIRAEWADGKVELMSPVSHVHQRIGNFLFRVLSEFVEAHDLGEVFQLEFQMKLNKERAGREPDLFFVPKSRLQFVHSGFFDGPGDLVIEIVSPDSIARDYEDKFIEYQSGGVLEYWLIDPLTQQVNFFQRDSHGRFQRKAPDSDGVYHSVGLPGFWLREEWLWQSPAPSLSFMRQQLGLF